MFKLTITHGEYDNLETVVHESEGSHGWNYIGDGFWQFHEGDTPGSGGWDAIVSDVRTAVDERGEHGDDGWAVETREVVGQTGKESMGMGQGETSARAG